MKTWKPNQPLEFLVCGYPIRRIDPYRPYGSLRGNATRAFGLANNFARQGYRTALIVDEGCEAVSSPLISEELYMVPRKALKEAAASTHVVILACTNLKTLQEHDSQVISLAHPRKWVASCFDYNDDDARLRSAMGGVIGVSFNNNVQAQAWRNRGLGAPVHVVPYGVDENCYVDDQITEVTRPTAVWIGVLRLPALLERIVRFAEVNPECDVKVVSGLVFDQRQARGGVGSQDSPYIEHDAGPVPIERFADVVRLWCGRAVPSNLRYLGACSGRNAELLGAANLALGFSRHSGQLHDDSKVLDYLRSGTPVLCDDGQPSCRFVRETEHGFVIPFDSGDEALREGFHHCLAISSLQRRRTVAARVSDQFSWHRVALKAAEWIRDDVKIAQASDAGKMETGPLKTTGEAIGLNSGAPRVRLLYIPWIDGHTGALVRYLESAGGVEFVPLPILDLIPGRPGAHRFEIMQLAKTQPHDFHRLLRDLVSRIAEPVNALLLTVDWCEALRQTTQAFRESGFPTVLVPHESVFAREDLYYVDPESGTNVPQAEVALLWGKLQEQIFRNRGMAANRLAILGSPKLDFVRNYRSGTSRANFYARWGFRGDKPVVLFAAQPLDNQFDTPRALIQQSRAIADCLGICRQRGWRLIVRLPPARDLQILFPQLVPILKKSGIAAIDGANEGRHLATPHDALFFANAVVSINSTMLLEASLMERPALSVGYVPCDQFWHRKGGLPLVQDSNQLEAGLVRAMSERRSLFTAEGSRWIEWAFSNGSFDGLSANRILRYIGERWPEFRRPVLRSAAEIPTLSSVSTAA